MSVSAFPIPRMDFIVSKFYVLRKGIKKIDKFAAPVNMTVIPDLIGNLNIYEYE